MLFIFLTISVRILASLFKQLFSDCDAWNQILKFTNETLAAVHWWLSDSIACGQDSSCWKIIYCSPKYKDVIPIFMTFWFPWCNQILCEICIIITESYVWNILSYIISARFLSEDISCICGEYNGRIYTHMSGCQDTNNIANTISHSHLLIFSTFIFSFFN